MQETCQYIVEGREWGPDTDTFIPPLAILGDPNSRWLSALNGDEFVGVAGYHKINWIDSKAEIFTAVVPKWRGSGAAQSLVRAQIEFGHNDMGLRRLTMTTLAGSPSAKIATKMGLKPEGVFPRCRLKRGVLHDALAFGVER